MSTSTPTSTAASGSRRAERRSSLLRSGRDAGQATAEYALVLLGASGIAVLLGGWAAKTGKVGSLLNAIVDQIATHVR